jgi:competence protein ComEA
MRVKKWVCLVALCPWIAWALEINHASEADLDSLRGVGPATTQRLLAERGRRPFADWADLMARVKGVRAPTARKLSDQGLTVNGLAFDHRPDG